MTSEISAHIHSVTFWSPFFLTHCRPCLSLYLPTTIYLSSTLSILFSSFFNFCTLSLNPSIYRSLSIYSPISVILAPSAPLSVINNCLLPHDDITCKQHKLCINTAGIGDAWHMQNLCQIHMEEPESAGHENNAYVACGNPSGI